MRASSSSCRPGPDRSTRPGPTRREGAARHSPHFPVVRPSWRARPGVARPARPSMRDPARPGWGPSARCCPLKGVGLRRAVGVVGGVGLSPTLPPSAMLPPPLCARHRPRQADPSGRPAKRRHSGCRARQGMPANIPPAHIPHGQRSGCKRAGGGRDWGHLLLEADGGRQLEAQAAEDSDAGPPARQPVRGMGAERRVGGVGGGCSPVWEDCVLQGRCVWLLPVVCLTNQVGARGSISPE